MAADGVLLVMGSGHQQYREYLLASAAEVAPVWLFDPQPPTWQQPYIQGSTVFDVFDPVEAVLRAKELAATTRILGVYCYHEGVISAAASVAAALELPGPTPAAVGNVRDKNATRELLTAAGFVQPRRALVRDLAEATAEAERIGFPLVAKPRGLGASQGVIKVGSAAELAAAVEISRSAVQAGMDNSGGVLLEEYLTGPEISIDAAVFEGEYLPYLVARKELGPEPFFEEQGHRIDAEDPFLRDAELLAMVAEAHRVLGWTHGMTHTEVKLTPRGPAIIEVNGRLGGDLIPYVGSLANGLDSGRISADVSLGVRPDLTPSRTGHTAIRFRYPPVDARVGTVRLPAADSVPGLVESVTLVGPGDELRLPPHGYVNRYGYLVARGESAEDCRKTLEQAVAATEFTFERLASPAA
ncbi:ATP-grasp domain-containing protein [Kitasatospora sp. NPDC093806]|uniref:ATP-grasp domain-containing protein n=1 Tax=Kitasatospora sp. NPDC093806 TaxID=3155075 RepID=UPI003446983D